MADNIISGIIPFDSDDPSILLKSTLTSAASITSPLVGSAGSVNGSGHTFDSTYGFKNPATGTSGVTWANLTGYQALDNAGQISFEIEREAVCAKATVYGSTGDNPPADYSGQTLAWVIVWTADGGTTYGNIRKSQGDANGLTIATKQAGETAGFVSLHTQLKPQFVRVTMSWRPGYFEMFIDGRPVSFSTVPTRDLAWADQFKTIWLQHFNGGNGVRGRYMRNILVSNKPVMLPKTQKIRVAFYGHSFSANYGLSNGSSAYDDTMGQMLRGMYALRNSDVEINVDGVGGGYVISALTSAGFQLRNSTFINSLGARKANRILLMAGTNDVGNVGFSSGAYDTDFKAMLTAIDATHDRSFEQKILVCNVPTRNAETSTWSQTIADNITAANLVHAALPAWWNTNFAARTGQLIALDLFSAWGGMIPTDPVQTGQLSGASANLHPSGLGSQRIFELARQYF